MSDEFVGVVVDRKRLLAHLDEGPVTKPALADSLGVSRSTVDRAVRALATHDLVAPTRTDGGERGYRTTLAGSLVVDAVEEFVTRTDAIREAAPLLAHCAPDAPCTPAFLVGAEVTRATPPAPIRALDRVADVLKRAEHFRGFARSEPRTTLTTTLLERCVAGELTVEMVTEDDLLDHVVGEHTAAVEEAVRGGHLRLHTRASLPYGLAVADPDDPDRRFAAIVVDDGPDLQGVISTDDPEAVAWADDLVDRYVADAVDIAPGG